jgi:DNA topoisomerase-1
MSTGRSEGIFTAELAQGRGPRRAVGAPSSPRKDEKGNPPTSASRARGSASTRASAPNSSKSAARSSTSPHVDDIVGPKDFSAEADQGTPREIRQGVRAKDQHDLTPRVQKIAELAGLRQVKVEHAEDPAGKGPARFLRTVAARSTPTTPYTIKSIETKRSSSRPTPPFITSTLQQAASSRLGFGAQRTMRAAQQLYEGVDIPGEGPRAHHLHAYRLDAPLQGRARHGAHLHPQDLRRQVPPRKAQLLHQQQQGRSGSPRGDPPDVARAQPPKLKNVLKPDQFRLYELIWQRFVACQMTAAQWDVMTVTIVGGKDPKTPLTFKAGGRTLVFDGFYRVAGVPHSADEQTLPTLAEKQKLAPYAERPDQKFTSPPRVTAKRA